MLPTVDTPVGVVFYALVATAIAAILRFTRTPLINFTRRTARRMPAGFRSRVTSLGYWLVPRWRSFAAGSARTNDQLNTRLDSLVGRKFRIAAVGGVYTDLVLGPVHLDPPSDVELADLEYVKWSAGGAVHHLASHLWEPFRRTVRLFSIIGQHDAATKTLVREIQSNPGVSKSFLSPLPGRQSGFSLHLQHELERALPTLTYSGPIDQLRWGDILRDLQRTFRYGAGVLHISSIFRTALVKDLQQSISQLSPAVLVILDLGRTDHHADEAKKCALVGALQNGAIDILISTIIELRAFGRANGIQENELKDAAFLRAVVEGDLLPRVCIVRGTQGPGLPRAVLICDGQISLIEGDNSAWTPKRTVGGQMAFNAALIASLTKRRNDLALRDKLRACVREALVHWSTVD